MRGRRPLPWTEIARMRDHLTHHYFDTAHSFVRATATDDFPLLAAAVLRLRSGLNARD
ncbi:HepT-like ribonuclease domain-containing protein [Subtercola boreus]|uniref:HepT-like ribonuclease domain-containing protein n=1 Tax=Subtercola boreus TaxID=120213 RepID=UPI0034612D08